VDGSGVGPVYVSEIIHLLDSRRAFSVLRPGISAAKWGV
jgi:hypothetical protein